MSRDLDWHWRFLQVFCVAVLVVFAVWIAFQKPALQDLPEWIWQIKFWKSGLSGMKLEPTLNYGLLGPYLAFEALRQGLGDFAVYILWGFGGAALFLIRDGSDGLVEFAAFLFFPYFFWMGNIAFLDACLVGLLFLYASERGWSAWILIPLGILCTLMHGAVGLALLGYLCFHVAFSLLFREDFTSLRAEIGTAACLISLFFLQACVDKVGSTGIGWGSLHYKIGSIIGAFSAVTFADGVIFSSISGFCLAALVFSLVCKILWFVNGRRVFRTSATRWAISVLIFAGCLAPTALGSLVRPDQRILFCGLVFYLFLSSAQEEKKSGIFKNFLLSICFLSLFFSVFVNLRYDACVRKTAKKISSAAGFHEIFYSEILSKKENLWIYKILPSYNEQRIIFYLGNALPTPTFGTLFSWVGNPRPPKMSEDKCGDLDGYQQQLCFKGLK